MRYRDLLLHREYRLLFSGQVLSQLGDAIYEVGIVWLIYRMTGSPAALGWLAISQSLPFLICGLFAGAYADRLDRRITMLVSDVLRGLAVLYLLVRHVTGGLSVWEVCAVAVVLTVARSFFHPSMRAILPHMLPREDLLLANSLSEAAKRICKVGGMTLGGLLMATERPDLVLGINGASFFLSAVTVYFIRTRVTSPHEKTAGGILRDIGLAGREIGKNRMAWAAILFSSLGLLLSAGMIKIGLPLLAGETLGGGGDVYGLLMACFSIGMFFSAALMKKMSRLPLMAMISIGWAVYGAAFLVLSAAPPLWVAFAVVLLTGFAHFLTDIPVTTYLQLHMPMHRMSAVQSIWATASFGSESLSSVWTGAVLGGVAVSMGFAGTGGILLVLGTVPLILWRRNGQNRLDRRSLPE